METAAWNYQYVQSLDLVFSMPREVEGPHFPGRSSASTAVFDHGFRAASTAVWVWWFALLWSGIRNPALTRHYYVPKPVY